MITRNIKTRTAPGIVAVFSFRYDAHLVPALLDNIDPLVDGWIAFDDRDGSGVFTNEMKRRRALLEAARETGARWAIAVDPDERFETGLASEIRALAADPGPACYTFALREMFAEQAYRVDGLWGAKRQARMLPLTHGLEDTLDQLHRPWSHFVPGHHLIDTPFNLYHLKMITAARRRARVDLYNHLDPDRHMQAVGYDYLADETGAEFETIPAGREYAPAHVEDDGLWMPRVEA